MADIKCKPMPLMTERQIEKFWSAVSIADPSECWDWAGARFRSGYGNKTVNSKGYLSHRLAYFLANKVDPNELMVCHHCDNRSCCNPSHLFLGTRQDNVDDMVRKGRVRRGDESSSRRHPELLKRGESHPRAKLSVTDIDAIKSMRLKGISFKAISKIFNVSDSTVCNAHNRLYWKHIDPPSAEELSMIPDTTARGERIANAKLKVADVIEIRRLCSSGDKISSIALRFNVTIGCISLIKKRINWKHV